MSSGLKITLIEDEPILVSLYTSALQRLGEVDVATNRAEAELLFQGYIEVRRRPDIILLDLIIPPAPDEGVNYFNNDHVGFQLLNWLREESFFQEVPILVLTNLDSSEDRKQAELLGARNYLIKSNIVPKDIVAQIQSLVE